MVRKLRQWFWSHRLLSAGCFLLFALVAVNAVAYRHAYAMTHFVSGGSSPHRPESLSLLQKARLLLTGVRLRRSANTETPENLGLPFVVHRFAGARGGDLEGWLIEPPDPKGLVLMFHGYASCKAGLLREAQALHELGYATFLLDFRGSGGSSGSETTIGVEEAEDVARTWEYAGANWPDEPLILYGQSMGGAAVLRAVAVHDVRPRAVVVECPFDRLVSTVANRFHAMGLPAFPGAQLLVFWGGVQHGFDGFRHNPVDYARKVEAPVLLLHGEEDPRVTRPQVESIFVNFPGTKRLEMFPGTGHESYVARHPGKWKQAVAEFLAAHGTGVRP